MGIIISTKDSDNQPSSIIPRQKRLKASEVIHNGQVDSFPYIVTEPAALSQIILQVLIELKTPLIIPTDISLYFLWYISYFLPKLHSAWRNYMTDILIFLTDILNHFRGKN